jgi:hypothetical protein
VIKEPANDYEKDYLIGRYSIEIRNIIQNIQDDDNPIELVKKLRHYEKKRENAVEEEHVVNLAYIAGQLIGLENEFNNQ